MTDAPRLIRPDAADHAPDDSMARPRLPRDWRADQSFCPECGEPCDRANVGAFETLGLLCCDDCASDAMAADSALEREA